ncbi:MAG: S-layer homology domain-containing protein [Oscillibacter sp.]
MPIDITVSGITPNAPPPSGGDSGGGDSGYEEPAIRVENELNKDDVKSDTTLWPAHTTESGGVSTTTVTDAELKALLELARQHAKDTEDIPGEGLKEGIFSIEDLRPSSQNNTYVLELTGDQLHTLEQENWDRLTVQTPAGSFSLYSEALTQAGAEITDGDQPVRITLHRLDHENRPGVDASLTVNKNQVTSFETPYGVRIVVPYTPAPGEDVNALIIDYIHEDGTVERVSECHYDPEAGGVVFFTTHLSKFGVAYRPAAFADVTAKHWANPYVTFLASRGVISGDGGKKFRPDDLATRSETIAMLTKALSAVKCPKKPIQVYTDVKLSSSISGASNWLYFNNLAPFFTTGTKLKPSAPVAKQDVAALVNNITDGVGLRLRSRGLDTGYTDLGELADYAKPAVVRLTAAGILPMTSNFKFNPKTNLNRGELAQITATLLSNL